MKKLALTLLLATPLAMYGNNPWAEVPAKEKKKTEAVRSTIKDLRPQEKDRLFRSDAVERQIQALQDKLTAIDPKLFWMFQNCFPNTLDTTVFYSRESGDDDTFVITGDIEAMWLRDSAAQVWPYLRYINEDEPLRRLIRGVILRQIKCILIDPYANAFNNGPTGGEWQSDNTKMKLELHERKYEIDSLCYPIRLAYAYWKMPPSLMRSGFRPYGKSWVFSRTSRTGTDPLPIINSRVGQQQCTIRAVIRDMAIPANPAV